MTEDNYIITQETEEEDKDQKIDTLISELETINYQGIESSAFDYSNDRNNGKLIPQIIETSNKIPGEIRTVIMVGSGPLFNIPKELSNIDLIISLDINSKQLERNRARIQEILLAQNTQDLLPSPNPDIKDNDMIMLAQERQRLTAPTIEMESYGNYHYMSSDEKLLETQDYFKKAKIAYVCGDISNKEFTNKLGNILNSKDAKIVFAGFSNISEWVCRTVKMDPIKRDAYIDTLSSLPIDQECPILHSRSIGRIGRSPIISKLSTGLKEYSQSLMTIEGLF